MNIKNIFNTFVFLLILMISHASSAMDRDFILKIAEETLLLNEENDSNINNDKIEKNLLEIKEMLQLEMKRGNPSSPIDIYLFLKGVLKDDINSLQSLLSQNENQELPNYISRLITYSVAKKLAVALKENRIAVKTKVVFKKPPEKNNCNLYVNGNLLNSTSSFYTPAGILIYIALYCNDNTFEIQKLRPGETQEIHNISFHHFVKSQNIPVSIPNPNSAKQINILENSSENIKNHKTEKNGIQFGTGVEFLKDFGTLSNENIRNLRFSKGSLLYSSSYLKYKYFLISLDYSTIILKEKQQIIFIENNLESETKIDGYVNGNGHFIRPGIGLRIPIIYFSEDVKIESDLLTNIIFIKGESSISYKMGYGFQGSVGPSFELGSGLIFDLKLGMGYVFGNLNGLQLSTRMQLGYSL